MMSVDDEQGPTLHPQAAASPCPPKAPGPLETLKAPRGGPKNAVPLSNPNPAALYRNRRALP